jgi:hypothetical protein
MSTEAAERHRQIVFGPPGPLSKSSGDFAAKLG